MNIKGAIFDMDGTLIDSLGFWDICWKNLGKKYLGSETFWPSAEDEKAIRTMTLQAAMELVYKNYGLGESVEELLATTEAEIAAFYSETVQVKEGVTEFLEYLAGKGVKMCVASATAPHLVGIAMKHCGLEKYFSFVLSCSTLGLGKDKPDVFLLALERLGTEKDKTWLFEDSLVALETASAAGFKTVGIYDKHTPDQDKIERVSTVYVSPSETLLKLVDMPAAGSEVNK